MSDFNSMTLMAAGEMIAEMSTQAAFSSLVLGWDVDEFCGSGSVSSKANSLVKFAKSNIGRRSVPTVNGKCDLSRAMIEHAITASDRDKNNKHDVWARLVAGLKMDGFEILEEMVPDPIGTPSIFDDGPRMVAKPTLRRMLPEDVPETDFREATSEVETLLDRHGFRVAEGHLTQAIRNFSQGNWSSANAMIRDYYQELLDKIAEHFGCDPKVSDDAKRHYLADQRSGPFLFHEYNEWENDRGKPAYVLGLWARLHPHGSHPGLSDEEDCAFRFQIILITSRIFLRRFDRRVSRK
ncbi:hypothetical protein [Pararhodobacter oceanensis]|uniref:hypothetical protein n=1 Tax=Pararhodobacter oceanensis TaxID=2172121 RepID=UPI003A8FD05F